MEGSNEKILPQDMLEAVKLGFITVDEALEFYVYVRIVELRRADKQIKLSNKWLIKD